ncbi:serine hydrolase-like protein isoform X2 [Halichondria panicea]
MNAAKMSTSVEIQLTVPWGHISGKSWGNPAGKHVLALHGWLDNAGSFDTLIPLLSSDLHVVAIDLPGHGRSSHRPRGSTYNAFQYVADVQYVIDALKWEKFSLLSHSLGAGVSSWFAASQPNLVERLVLLDGGGFVHAPVADIPKLMGRALSGLSAGDKMLDNKSFSTWDSVVDKVWEGQRQRQVGFSREAAGVLAVRGAIQMESGEYRLTRDLRLKQPSLLRITEDTNTAFLAAIQCPVLFIRAEDSYLDLELFKSSIEAIRKSNLQQLTVAGGHHVHLEHPERISGTISDFFQNTSCPGKL